MGLGSGRAASLFTARLGARVREGLRVSGVPTSRASAELAREAGIPLVEPGDAPLDVTIDGADEVGPDIDLVTGWGGALVRERLVMREVKALGLVPTLRTQGDATEPFISDNGNLTIDCAPREPLDGRSARALERALLGIVGVVNTGLLLGTADRVLVGYPDGRVNVPIRPDPAAGILGGASIPG